MQIQVRDKNGVGIPRINIRVSEGTKPSDQAIFDVFTDLAGNTGWPIPFWPVADYTLWINDQNVNESFNPTSVFVTSGNNADIQIELEPSSSGSSLPKLVRIDKPYHRFVTDAGKRVFVKGATDFLLYNRYLRGEDITPLLKERADLGFNMVRVFGMCHYVPVNEFNWPAFKPQDYGNAYYDGLHPFAQACAQNGLYVYYSCFPDNALIMPDLGQKQEHHARVVGQLSLTGTVLYELTNENDAHDFNYVDASKFAKPNGMLSCAGSEGEGTHSFYWDFFDFHPRRDYPAHTKDCNLADNPNFLMGREGMIGEPDRYGWNGNPNMSQAFESAGSSKGTSLAWVFHSKRGLRSEPFDDETANIARAVVEVLS